MLTTRRVLLAATAASVVPWGAVHAQSGDAQREAEVVRARLLSFLDRLVELSKEHAPPGVNAANGEFTLSVHAKDPFLADLVTNGPTLVTDEGKALWTQFTEFAQGIRQSFSTPPHEANWTTAGGAILKAAWDAAQKQVVDFAVTVATSGFSAEAAKKAFDDIGKALDGKISWSGPNANGWLSDPVHETSSAFAARPAPTAVTTPIGKRVFSIMQIVSRGWMTLPTKVQNGDNHKPWLRAEWQAGFEGIAAGGAAALRTQP